MKYSIISFKKEKYNEDNFLVNQTTRMTVSRAAVCSTAYCVDGEKMWPYKFLRWLMNYNNVISPSIQKSASLPLVYLHSLL